MGTQKHTKKNEDQFGNEFLSEANVLVEVKVSEDDGGTWHRCKISMVSGLEESGLQFGNLFQFNGEKYRVTAGDDGLMVEPLEKAVGNKQSTKQRR